MTAALKLTTRGIIDALTPKPQRYWIYRSSYHSRGVTRWIMDRTTDKSYRVNEVEWGWLEDGECDPEEFGINALSEMADDYEED